MLDVTERRKSFIFVGVLLGLALSLPNDAHAQYTDARKIGNAGAGIAASADSPTTTFEAVIEATFSTRTV